ncbi:MAG: alpha/beta hydrolase family protein [Planctomycetes bacterium]|nr:alpha/beta hydrolase family protein [Planctomycetota bacterium]
MPALNYSPSLVHRAAMRATKPALSYKGGDVGQWQRKLRKKLVELVGAMPAKRCPLRVRTLWSREHPLGRIEKIVFTAEAHADVPAYVCVPKNAKPPYDWMICLQGHSTGMHNSIAVALDDESKTIEVAGDRDFGLGCLRRGVAALCIEQRSFGERKEKVQKQVASHGCHDATMQALLVGRTLLGERVWDVDRGIDYLETRRDVKMKTIGVMGNSGGGTISVFAAALLPRVRIAMPSCYFCTFADSIGSIYHCADNYIPGILNHGEMYDVMGLFAPRPVTIVAGQADSIFPIAAVKRAFAKLKRIYRAAGAADRCHLVVGPEGHRFYADLAWPKTLKELKRIG